MALPYLNIVIPFKVYILGDTSALTSFWRDYSNATLSIKTESNQHLETTSFVYAIKTKVERPYAKYGELRVGSYNRTCR